MDTPPTTFHLLENGRVVTISSEIKTDYKGQKYRPVSGYGPFYMKGDYPEWDTCDHPPPIIRSSTNIRDFKKEIYNEMYQEFKNWRKHHSNESIRLSCHKCNIAMCDECGKMECWDSLHPFEENWVMDKQYTQIWCPECYISKRLDPIARCKECGLDHLLKKETEIYVNDTHVELSHMWKNSRCLMCGECSLKQILDGEELLGQYIFTYFANRCRQNTEL